MYSNKLERRQTPCAIFPNNSRAQQLQETSWVFQIFELLAKIRSTSCSPNLSFVLSHPQNVTAIYTSAKNMYLDFTVLYFKFFTYSLISQNKFKQPLFLWMFTHYIFPKTLFNPFSKLFWNAFLYPLVKYDKAEHFTMKKNLLYINSKFSLNIVYSFQRVLELSIDESPRSL